MAKSTAAERREARIAALRKALQKQEANDLRMIRFSDGYWHVVSENHGMIVGTILHCPGVSRPWRAEYTGISKDWPLLKVGHFKSKQKALESLRVHLQTEIENT